MRQPILLLLLVFAFITLISVFAARVARPQQLGALSDIVGGIVGMLIWGVVALGSLGIETFNPATGDTITYSEPALSWIAVAFAVLSLVVTFDGTHRLVDFGVIQREMDDMPGDMSD